MTFKRLLSYIIDLTIIFIVIVLIKNLLVTSEVNTLNHDLSNLMESFLGGQLFFSTYFKEASTIIAKIDKESILVNLMNFVVISSLVIIIPYFMNGRTIGSKIMKLEIKANDNKLTIGKLILRSTVLFGFFALILFIPLPFILPSTTYYLVVSILSFVQILLVIISGFMVLYSKDKRGLQDIISNTNIERRLKHD